MDLYRSTSFKNRKHADLLLVPFYQGKKHAEEAVDCSQLKQELSIALAAGDFLGKQGETLLSYVADGLEKRLLFVGLGDKSSLTVEKLRRIYGPIAKLCRKKRWTSINLMLPDNDSLSAKEVITGVAEGLFLSNYGFGPLKTVAEEDKKEKDLDVSPSLRLLQQLWLLQSTLWQCVMLSLLLEILSMAMPMTSLRNILPLWHEVLKRLSITSRRQYSIKSASSRKTWACCWLSTVDLLSIQRLLLSSIKATQSRRIRQFLWARGSPLIQEG